MINNNLYTTCYYLQLPEDGTTLSDRMIDLTCYDEYDIQRDYLEMGETLGEGSFGLVRKARLKHGPAWMKAAALPQIVAVKGVRGRELPGLF